MLSKNKKWRLSCFVVILGLLLCIQVAAAYSPYYPYGVVWNEKDGDGEHQIRFRYYDGGSWSASSEFGNQNFKIYDTQTNQWAPQLAFDKNGNPVICFVEVINGNTGAKDVKGAVWNGTHWEITVLDSIDYGYVDEGWSYFCRIAMAPNGNIGVTWSEQQESNTYWRIRFREWDGNRWSNASEYSNSPRYQSSTYYHYKLKTSGQHQYSPELAYDMFNRPVIVFIHNPNANIYANHWIDGRWEHYDLDTYPDLNYNSNGYDCSPRVEMAPNGHVGVIWEYCTGSYRTRFREWDGIAWSSRYDWGAVTNHYVDNSGSVQRVRSIKYDDNSNPFIGFYDDNGDNEVVRWTGKQWTNQKIDNGQDDTTGSTPMYALRMERGPANQIGAVWCERDGTKNYVRFREYNGVASNTWSQSSDYGNTQMKIFTTFWEFVPDMLYDNNSIPVIVYYTAHYNQEGHFAVSKWGGSSWSTSYLESSDNGDVRDTQPESDNSNDEYEDQDHYIEQRRPFIVAPMSNFWIQIFDENQHYASGKRIRVYRESDAQLFYSKESWVSGGFYCYLYGDEKYTVKVGPYGSIAYSVNRPNEMKMRYYDDTVTLENLTISVVDSSNTAVDEKKITVYESGSNFVAYEGTTNTDGQIIVSLDSGLAYTIEMDGKKIEHVNLPYNFTIAPNYPVTAIAEPTLISFSGKAEYANTTTIEGASVKLTIKDSNNIPVWGPYSYNDIASYGEFSLTLGGQNRLQLISGVQYTLSVEFCDLTSFTETAGNCVSGSSHYEEFTTYFVS